MAAGIGIAYVDGPRLSRSLLAAADWVAAGRDVETGDLLKAHVHTDTPDAVFTLAASWGAVESTKGWLGSTLNIKPILSISVEGLVEPVARSRGTAAARRRLLDRLDAALAGRPRELRLGVAHADCVVAPITPVIAAHAGVGAWGVFCQVEDGNKPVADTL